MESKTELIPAPSVDRGVLAITHLQMLFEMNNTLTDEMISEVSEAWSTSEEEAQGIATFLCEFVMEMRTTADEDDY